MKNRKISVSILMIAMGLWLTGCGENISQSISSSDSLSESSSTAVTFDVNEAIRPFTRGTNSGTRECFVNAIGLSAAKDDDSKFKGSVNAVSSNGEMVTTLAGNKYGIGYFSFDSKADAESKGLKLLDFEGVEPTEDTIIGETYKLARNFNYCIREENDATRKLIVQSFVDYMFTVEGMGVIKSNGGVLKIPVTAPSWSDVMKEKYAALDNLTENYEIRIGGSTSVEKIARQLSSSYTSVNANAHITFTHNHTGSGAAFSSTHDDKGTLDIGFASREFHLSGDEKMAEGTYGKICVDGVVVGVSKENPLTDITSEQLKKIYDVTDTTVSIWKDLA